jgi:uncharacterized protein
VAKVVLVDTGPLVAHFDSSERHHRWVADALRTVSGPLVTCEAVLTEACHLLRRWPSAVDALMGRVEAGELRLHALGADAAQLRALMKRFASVPMSFADACLVRLTERHPWCVLITLDADFQVYRRNARQLIPQLSPHR